MALYNKNGCEESAPNFYLQRYARQIFLPVLFCVAVLFAGILYSDEAKSDSLVCPGTDSKVFYNIIEDAQTVCVALKQASTFLKENGFTVEVVFKIHLLEKIPEVKVRDAFGCYEHKTGEIYILDFASCYKQKKIFGLPVDRVLYQSIVVHEIAHAIVSHNFPIARKFLTQEYIAYVAQISSIPPQVRDMILEGFTGDGNVSDKQINLTVYMMEPDVFGVKAYRHYKGLGNGAGFLKELMMNNSLE